ncbi:MAG TPA: rod shape-determining protein MreC [Candidatus Paceibacterota bacterium]
MTYPLIKHKYNDRARNKFYGILSLVIICTTVFYLWKGDLAPLFIQVLSPISKSLRSTGSSIFSWAKVLIPYSPILEENNRLKEEAINLRQEFFDLNREKVENQTLRQALDQKEANYIPTKIILAAPQTPFGTVVVDKGSLDGVSVGDRVLLSRKVSLGVVGEVEEKNSKVITHYSPGMKTSAIAERSGVVLELTGTGNAFALEVPLDMEMREGDVFSLPGSQDFVVAIVVSIKPDQAASFSKVFLSPPFNLLGNSVLFIETGD